MSVEVEAASAAEAANETGLAPPPLRRLSAFHNRRFLAFWLAVTFAMTGMWIRVTVQGYLVYELTDDKFLLGLVGFVSAIPTLVLSPVVGVIVDRFDRKRVLIVTQLVMGTNFLTMATLDAFNVLTVNQIMVLAAIAGCASAFDWPARLSIVPNLVDPEEMQSAVALNSASFNGARIIGPVIGGGLIAVIGTAACFYISAFAYLPSIVVLATLAIDRVVTTRHESPIQNLIGGYKYIWHFPTLRSLLSVDLFPVMFGMSFFALLPALTRDVYGSGSAGLGLLYAADGAGALLGVLTVAFLTGLRRRGRLVLIGVFFFAVFQIAFSAMPNLALGMIFIFLLGTVGSLYATLNDTLVQIVIDDAYRGRVMAVYSTFWGLTPIGYLEAGFVASQWGTQVAIGVNGCVVLLYVLALMRWNPEIRKLD